MREHDLKEEVRRSVTLHTAANNQRVILPESWKQYESTYGDDKSLAHVENLIPQVVKIGTIVGARAGCRQYVCRQHGWTF
jgi:hypothetical protein